MSTNMRATAESRLDGVVSPNSQADATAAVARLQANAEAACNLLRSMAHEGRLIILSLLSLKERSVMELEQSLDLRQPAVSQQLARLRSDNLVTTRRDGKMIYYSLASEEARAIIKVLTGCFG
jgi:DNA-binding transcriptional ArsR family regulator